MFEKNDDVDGYRFSKWVSGKIVEVNDDGTYDIKFKDGSIQQRVPKKMIRYSAEKTQGSSSVIGAVGSVAVFAAIPILGVGFWGGVALQVGWHVVGDILDKFVDGEVMSETKLYKCAKAIQYVLPTTALTYLAYILNRDGLVAAGEKLATAASAATTSAATGSAVVNGFSINPSYLENYGELLKPNSFTSAANTTAASAAAANGFSYNLSYFDVTPNLKNYGELLQPNSFTSAATTTASPNITANIPPDTLFQSLKGGLTNLFKMASEATGATVNFAQTNPGQFAVIVLTFAMIGWIIKTYIYTRFSGDKEDNDKLDKAIYSNHERRQMIIDAEMKRRAAEAKKVERQKREYERKVKQQIKLGVNEEKIEEETRKAELEAASDKKKQPKWWKFEPGKYPNPEKDFLYGDKVPLKTVRQRSKTSTSSRKRRRSSRAKSDRSASASARSDKSDKSE